MSEHEDIWVAMALMHDELSFDPLPAVTLTEVFHVTTEKGEYVGEEGFRRFCEDYPHLADSSMGGAK